MLFRSFVNAFLVTVLVSAVNSCPTDWVQHNKKCYKFSVSTGSWRDCLDACNDMSASMLCIDSTEGLDFVTGGQLDSTGTWMANGAESQSGLEIDSCSFQLATNGQNTLVEYGYSAIINGVVRDTLPSLQLSCACQLYDHHTFKNQVKTGAVGVLAAQPSARPTGKPISSPTAKSTSSPTFTPTTKPTRSPSEIPTKVPTPAPSAKPTPAPSAIPTKHPTPAPSARPTFAPSERPTVKPTSMPTARPTFAPSDRPTFAPSWRPTLRPTRMPTATPSWRPTFRPTPIPTSPTARPTPVPPSAEPTAPPTRQPTRAPTTKPSISPTLQPSTKPTAAPTCQPTRTPSCAPTAKPSGTPSLKPTSAPIDSPTAKPSPAPSIAPTRTPSVRPTAKPTSEPTIKPSGSPTIVPSPKPSIQPSIAPSAAPIIPPSARPSSEPTVKPTRSPSTAPSPSPSTEPSIRPSRTPTLTPSTKPSQSPTTKPTTSPTTTITAKPSVNPTIKPTIVRTLSPTVRPTNSPTARPTIKPSARPSTKPTKHPTEMPTRLPSRAPTVVVTAAPSLMPSLAPIVTPTAAPTYAPVIFNAEQEIQGVSYLDYVNNRFDFEAVLKMTIADSMDGITTNDIYNLVVSAGITTAAVRDSHSSTSLERSAAVNDVVSRNLRTNPRPLATGDTINIFYTVQVVFNGLTYIDLSTQLVNAVQSGAFNEHLHTHAVAQEVPVLSTAFSSAVQTEQVSTVDPNSDSSGSTKSDTLPVIIGAVVGGVCVLLAASVFAWIFLCLPPNTGGAPAYTANAATPPPPGPTPAQHMSVLNNVNVYVNGNMATTEPIVDIAHSTESSVLPSAPPEVFHPPEDSVQNNYPDEVDWENRATPNPVYDVPHSKPSQPVPAGVPTRSAPVMAAVSVPEACMVSHVDGDDGVVAMAEVYVGEDSI